MLAPSLLGGTSFLLLEDNTDGRPVADVATRLVRYEWQHPSDLPWILANEPQLVKVRPLGRAQPNPAPGHPNPKP